MDEKPKPGFDEHGWPLYDVAWFWHRALWPAILILACVLAVIAVFDVFL